MCVCVSRCRTPTDVRGKVSRIPLPILSHPCTLPHAPRTHLPWQPPATTQNVPPTSPCVFSRLGAMESTSSMKMMEGAFFSASWNTWGKGGAMWGDGWVDVRSEGQTHMGSSCALIGWAQAITLDGHISFIPPTRNPHTTPHHTTPHHTTPHHTTTTHTHTRARALALMTASALPPPCAGWTPTLQPACS